MTVNLTEDRVEVPTIAEGAEKTDAKASTKKMSQQKTMAVIQPTYVAEGGSAKGKSMKDVYYHKDKFEYTIWRLDGDTFTQLADWNSTTTARGKAGFVKTASRKRKTDNGGLSYLTPKDKKNVWVYPLTELPSAPHRLQSEVVAGLEAMGYTKDIEFKTPATVADKEKEATYAEATKPKATVAESKAMKDLKEERKRLKAKLDGIDVNTNSKEFYKTLDEVKAVESKIRKEKKASK
jgi:hypothetical protein